jgi:hypothetical protein
VGSSHQRHAWGVRTPDGATSASCIGASGTDGLHPATCGRDIRLRAAPWVRGPGHALPDEAADNAGPAARHLPAVKPYDIEIQRLKSMRHAHGLIEVSVDALVQTRKLRDDESPSTVLNIPVEHARTLLLLLRQQLAELDKLQPRSRRSGRA